MLDTADNQEQDEANVDAESEDKHPPFKTPRGCTPKRVRKNEDSAAQQAVNCLKSLSEVVNSRDEHSVYGEYVANKIRNCNKSRMEISLAQRYINDILFRLDMGMLAAEIKTMMPPSTSCSSVTSPTSYVSQESYCSNSSTPSANLEVVDVQLQQQLEIRDGMNDDIRDFVTNYTSL